MRKQIVTIVLGAVVMLGTATTLFAQNGPATGGYPTVMGGAAGNPGFVPGQFSSELRPQYPDGTRRSTTEKSICQRSTRGIATNHRTRTNPRIS